jgi:tetratricopeptide (TPR) repeat protein
MTRHRHQLDSPIGRCAVIVFTVPGAEIDRRRRLPAFLTSKGAAEFPQSSTSLRCPTSRRTGMNVVPGRILGYPDRALRQNDEKDAHARRRGHLFDLGWGLTIGAHEFDRRFKSDDLRKRAEECERLGRENSLPVLWAMHAPFSFGQAFIREGKFAEGIASLKAGIAAWEASGGKVRMPIQKPFLAEAMAKTGDLDDALRLIDEQIAQIERPGWEERQSYPEILRLKGWMLSLKGDLEGAERNFLASLDWARRQQAKSWELRTSSSLARLWQSQGKRQDAYELLAPVYGWFTEGFDTKDLLEAEGSSRRTGVADAAWFERGLVPSPHLGSPRKRSVTSMCLVVDDIPTVCDFR